MLRGRRGGFSTKDKVFERVRAEFGFRSSVLGGVGQFMSVPRSSTGAAPGRAAQLGYRGVSGALAFIEIWNAVIEPLVSGHQMGQRLFRDQNVLPFVRRLLFWNQAEVFPTLVGVDDPTLGSPRYERDYNRVVEGLNQDAWTAVYLDSPGLTDLDVLRFGVWLSQHVRNFDEFSLLFKDSGQDAVSWETPERGGWEQAIWKVRVGRYETAGSNHVVERWETHQKLTQLMNTFVRGLIANTGELLKARRAGGGQGAPGEELVGRLDLSSLPSTRVPAHLRPGQSLSMAF